MMTLAEKVKAREQKIKELKEELERKSDLLYKIELDLNYDEYYSNDTYSYPDEEEEDRETASRLEIEIADLKKEIQWQEIVKEWEEDGWTYERMLMYVTIERLKFSKYNKITGHETEIIIELTPNKYITIEDFNHNILEKDVVDLMPDDIKRLNKVLEFQGWFNA